MSLHLIAPGAFHDAYDRIRSENELPRAFGVAALEEAFAARPDGVPRRDLRHIPFVAIDPPGAVDLDQAVHIEKASNGHVVRYAIADVGAFVRPGGALDAETRQRGVTLYFPDTRIPLHPRIISEDRASLLPDRDRPALVWTITLDGAGLPISTGFERATVRVADAISYQAAQERLVDDERLALLEEVGRQRLELEAERGGISLDIPGQQVIGTPGGYAIEYERTLPIERWNAQISILTGIVAATTLVETGFGMVRTLPPPHPDDLDSLRLHAAGLGVPWPDSMSYPALLRSLDNERPAHVAFKHSALRTLRGAGYSPVSNRSEDRLVHGAIAAVYAHVTAPLRRLADRHLNEILLAVYGDAHPPSWAVEAASDWLAGTMVEARARQAKIDREVIDHSEATIMSGSVGQAFDAVVVRRRNGRARIQIAEPAVVADVAADDLAPGDRISVTLVRADPVAGELSFTVSTPS